MTGIYFPRLPLNQSLIEIKSMISAPIAELSNKASASHEMQYFYDMTKQIDTTELLALRDSIVSLANEFGFPHNEVNKNVSAKFDRAAAGILYDNLNLLLAEAASSDVWSFLTLVLLPDVAKWRFPNKKGYEDYERWLGTDRNVFRKLWWREGTLGRELSSQLGEDETVAIMERPRLGGNPDLARAMASSFLEMSKRYPHVSRQEIMRKGALNVRRLVPLISFEMLSSSELQAKILEVYEESTAAYDLLLRRQKEQKQS